MTATHQAAAAVLIVNRVGNVLMVANPYRRHLVLPGGVIEHDESPAMAAQREVREETGLEVAVSRLLVVEHLGAGLDGRSGLRFVFDTDTVVDGIALIPQPVEVSELLWLPPSKAISRHTPRGQQRLARALAARDTGGSVYMDHDVTLASPQPPAAPSQ